MAKSGKKTIVGNIHPDILAFTVGRDPILDMDLALWDCIGTAAHVTMLSAMKRVTPAIFTARERDLVIQELCAVIGDVQSGRFSISEADQDVHLAVERRLTAVLGDLGRKVHTGRSRNDQVAVDIRLHMRDQILSMIGEVAQLARRLVTFGVKHAAVPMVGRTHLQPAMPSSLGLWATAWAESLLDDLFMVEAAYKLNDRCPLGSAASYGVPLPIDRRMTARLLGFEKPHHNVLHAANARGKIESVVLAACAQIMLTLSRLAEDLILFSMPEFGYFVLPPELCTGSSIMPQKYNPDVLELIRAKTAVVMGCADTVGTILKAMPGGYNRDLQDTKELYMDGIRTTRSSVRIMTLLVESLGICEAKLRDGFGSGVFATDKALELVASGMPFREAYQYVRTHLDDLEQADPDAALSAKSHLGAPAGLDFAAYRERIKEVLAGVKSRRAASRRALRKVLRGFARTEI
jgi:argininosuccinate lyase